MSDEHLHAPTGAYALDALPDDERDAFERHLETCPACAQEVRELTATAARLGVSAATAPPPGMKAAVLAGIDSVRQLPPLVPGGGASAVSPVRRGRALPRLVLAACVAAAVGFGGVAAWQYQRADEASEQARAAQDQADRLTAVLSAPDARTVTGATEGGTRATVVVSRERNSAVFVASGLPKPPAGKTYQLWFDDDGAMRPAGLVSSDGASVMQGGVDGASGVGVTVEPLGGSAEPTTGPLMVMSFPT
ncbi:anti-sigma factor [Streptomyces solincola]|uniref:Regulator of SigK n=1 Tax=Streptomyces solincola TaxID=2100817 RepID=A0A2S9PRB1_9ACTN|nr:anti-sigma factor [Streptomyces solincola]PRH76877.1 anti-sigma factor [Streptomyces solincola]